MRPLYRIYIDDSGNVDPRTTNAPEVRYGSISAVIIADEYLTTKFNPAFEHLSRKHFGTRPDGTLWNIHRRVLAKPPQDGPFSILNDEKARAEWDAAATNMFRAAQYVVITSCVDKIAWYFKYPDWSGDFYQVLVQCVLERCYYYLNNRNACAEVNIEHKNDPTNERIKAAYRGALTYGFYYISATKLRQVFTSVELNIIQKSDCRPGAQLADLVASPALQHIRHLHTGRHPIEGAFTQMVANILESDKFYREQDKGPDGMGRIWRP